MVNSSGVQDEPSAARKTSPAVRRQRHFVFAAAAAALVSLGGVIGSVWIKSPAQLAADHRPPTPSTLTAPVLKQILKRTVVVRGVVTASRVVTVTPTQAQGAGTLVITRLTKRVGDAVKAGDVVIEVSGRPVIALPGAVPAYRDLRPGDNGKDVAELQTALSTLGYPDPDARGVFGSGTKRAVSHLYGHLGYAVATTGGPNDAGDAQALNAAAQAVVSAQRAIATDQANVAAAQAALDSAKATSPPDPGAVATAQSTLDAARQTLEYGKQDLTAAKAAQRNLIATTGVEMPLNEFVFLSTFPAHLASVNGGVGSSVTAPLVTLDTGSLVVNAVLQQDQRAFVKVGMAVRIDAEQLNQEGLGKIAGIGPYRAATGQQTGAGGSDGAPAAAGYPIVVAPAKGLADDWLNQDVRLTITAGSTPGPVLVVPVSAIFTGQDGTTSVTILSDGGLRTRVAVGAGLDSNGMVEVTPRNPGALEAGDLVVIG